MVSNNRKFKTDKHYRYLPELTKVWKGCGCHKNAIGESISQEEDEKLVVCKANTIVDPWTVVIHFCDTDSTDTAVMTSVWFDVDALLTVSS